MYIKQKEEAQKTVFSTYIVSIQKQPKVAPRGGNDRNTPPSLT